MEATTKQLREIASVRQRAEEMANRFMRFLKDFKSFYRVSILLEPKFMAKLDKENMTRVIKENNL